MRDYKFLDIKDLKNYILFMDYNIILYYVQDLYGLSRPTVQGGTHNGVIVLLGTHHIFHYIALGVAMFLSLNVFSQIYG
jgi:hypothetical protein